MVTAPFLDAECAYLLVVLRREDFLVGTGEGAIIALELLTVIDVGKAVLADLVSGEDVEADLFALRVMDFVNQRSMGEVNVWTSPALSSLGHGRFLLHVLVTLPVDSDTDTDEASEDEEAVGGRLVVISSHAEAVIWTATETDGVGLVDEPVALASNGSTFAAGSASSSSIVVVTPADPVVHCSIDSISLLAVSVTHLTLPTR